ncbi:MAG: VWA domain-containing protein [Acidobacteria bacterium]|nr:VWA domain-containing protein [Acidobacteriota bacterium]MBI3426442.1 VWA domain-containing protein [Acidobacteriota bacterium]
MRFSTIRIFLMLGFALTLLLGNGVNSAAQSAHRQRYPKTKPNEPANEPPQTTLPSQPSTTQSATTQQAGQKPKTEPKKNDGQPNENLPDVPANAEAIKIETELVTVPVIVSDHNDIYVPDLAKEEFTIYEDGVKQEIAFFATDKEPFNVVLMLDTSASTQEKLGLIQKAAKDFTTQLQPQDRIKVMAFDEAIHDLSEFTNDRALLRAAIDRTRPGKGTILYDAMKYALNTLLNLRSSGPAGGRKAIVIFTDGVDSYSDTTRYEDNIAQLEEAGVIVYPIRYDTRRDVEAMLRGQPQNGTPGGMPGGTLPNGKRPPIGTTPPTTPGDDSQSPVPTSRPGGKDPYGLPLPPISIPIPGRYPGGGRYPDDRGRGRYPDERAPGGGRYPDSRNPNDRSGNRYPDEQLPDARYPGPPDPRRNRDDALSTALDGMYRTAALYLNELASVSGGNLYFAEDLNRLTDVFAKIADELRKQYSLGYYPANQARDGRYRKLQVKVRRKNVVVRARPGYRAPK